MTTRRTMLGLALGVLLSSWVRTAEAAGEIPNVNLRGRYTGHVTLGASFSDGTTTQRLDVQMLTALQFDGKLNLAGDSRVTISLPGQATPVTCPFTITGMYAFAENGLGTATLVLAPSDDTCGDAGVTGITLQASLLVGGVHRRRLDLTINGGTEPSGATLPIVGAGTLEK